MKMSSVMMVFVMMVFVMRTHYSNYQSLVTAYHYSVQLKRFNFSYFFLEGASLLKGRAACTL